MIRKKGICVILRFPLSIQPFYIFCIQAFFKLDNSLQFCATRRQMNSATHFIWFYHLCLNLRTILLCSQGLHLLQFFVCLARSLPLSSIILIIFLYLYEIQISVTSLYLILEKIRKRYLKFRVFFCWKRIPNEINFGKSYVFRIGLLVECGCQKMSDVRRCDAYKIIKMYLSLVFRLNFF